MKATKIAKAVLLFLALAFIPMMGFAQTDDRKEQAKEASLSLTKSMASALSLTEAQIDSVSQCNLSYALVLFTTDPLTDDAMIAFEATLDDCLKEILSKEQYKNWVENRKEWLDEVKKNLPAKEEDILEQEEGIEIL